MNPKTVSGDNFLKSVIIEEDLTVDGTTTTKNMVATTATIGAETVGTSTITNLNVTGIANIANEYVTNSTLTNATIVTASITNSTLTNTTISTESVVNSNITNATIGTAGITNAHIGSETVGSSLVANGTVTNLNTTNVNINNSSINFDSMAFYYISGSFQPILTYLLPDGTPGGNIVDFVNVAGSSSTVNYENGYFERIGSQVTVHFSVSYNAINSGYVATGFGFPAIRNLPYTFGTLGGILDYQEINELGTCSWPNGIGGGIPSLYLPTYPYPYSGALYEANAVVPLDLWLSTGIDAVAVYKGPHTCDGTTIAINCNIEFYEADVAVPPYALSFSTGGLVSNFNMLATSTYLVSFEGRCTYNT